MYHSLETVVKNKMFSFDIKVLENEIKIVFSFSSDAK
jgi:hypothetical protein